MNTPLQTSIQHRLMQQRTELLAQIAQLRGGDVSRVEAAAAHFQRPEDSPAQVNTERALEFALDERELAELSELDAALQRLQAGTYGQCVDCGETIAQPRLLATPQVARCLACQTKKEHHA